MSVSVELADEQQRAVDAEDLVSLARHVLAERHVPDDMAGTLLLVDRETMTQLNADHLGERGATDVLAFPIDAVGESPSGVPAVLGDVVLCPEVAAEQAPRFDRSAHDELRLLTVHGLLHLLGMDHAEEAEEREMFALTEQLLVSHRRGTAPR